MDFKEQFVGVLNDAKLEPRSYSGRGMYGTECVGVTCPDVAELCGKLMAYLADEIAYSSDEEREAAIQFQRDVAKQIEKYTCTDSMGRDNIIIYWKNIPASLLADEGKADDDTEGDDD